MELVDGQLPGEEQAPDAHYFEFGPADVYQYINAIDVVVKLLQKDGHHIGRAAGYMTKPGRKALLARALRLEKSSKVPTRTTPCLCLTLAPTGSSGALEKITFLGARAAARPRSEESRTLTLTLVAGGGGRGDIKAARAVLGGDCKQGGFGGTAEQACGAAQ